MSTPGMPPAVSRRSLSAILRDARRRAPDWDRLFIEELLDPVLEAEEISTSLRAAGTNRREIRDRILAEGAQILAESGTSLTYRPQFRLWLQHLLEATSMRTAFAVSGVLTRHPRLGRAIPIALVAAWILPLAILGLTPWAHRFFEFSVVWVAVSGSLLGLAHITMGEEHRALQTSPESAERMREEAIIPRVNLHLNAILRTRGDDHGFHPPRAPALVDLRDPEHLISTGSIKRITRATEAMPSGSVGVSGPRGVGKSTLLRTFCEDNLAGPNLRDLRLLLSAPVHYNARDFIVHAFANLCEKVISVSDEPERGDHVRKALWNTFFIASLIIALTLWSYGLRNLAVPLPPLPGPDAEVAAGVLFILVNATLLSIYAIARPLPPALFREDLDARGPAKVGDGPFFRRWLLLSVLAAVGITLIFYFTAFPSEARVDLSGVGAAVLEPQVRGFVSIVLGVLLALTALAVGSRSLRQRPRENIVGEARRYLRRLRYLETRATGATGSVQVLKPAQIGITRNQSLAEVEMSLPQVTTHYREFATRVAAWWRERHEGEGRIIIGIDEIDKMSGEEAERFINDVKALFGTPHCLNLVSVSDDALSRFEQRAFRIRDSFDTAFDDIIRVEPLSHDDVRQLLTRRMAGISDSLVALCYVMSGGLPRECLRVARSLVRAHADLRASNPEHIVRASELAERVVEDEVNRIRGALFAMGTTDGVSGFPESVRDDLLDGAWPPITSDGLFMAAKELRNNSRTEVFGVQYLFLTAVFTVFADNSSVLADALREHLDSVTPVITLLARARAAGSLATDDQAFLVERFFARWEGWRSGHPSPDRAT